MKKVNFKNIIIIIFCAVILALVFKIEKLEHTKINIPYFIDKYTNSHNTKLINYYLSSFQPSLTQQGYYQNKIIFPDTTAVFSLPYLTSIAWFNDSIVALNADLGVGFNGLLIIYRKPYVNTKLFPVVISTDFYDGLFAYADTINYNTIVIYDILHKSALKKFKLSDNPLPPDLYSYMFCYTHLEKNYFYAEITDKRPDLDSLLSDSIKNLTTIGFSF